MDGTFPIPFKSQLHLHHGGFPIYMVEFTKAKTERFSREETDLLVREVKASKRADHLRDKPDSTKAP